MAEVSSLKIRLATAENERHPGRQTRGITGKLITRSSLESHKLDLMAEVSSVKIWLATAENERQELEDRLKGLQVRG